MANQDDFTIEYIPPEIHYQEPVATLLTIGNVREQSRYDYRSLGLGEEHIPELARLAVDPDLFWGDSDSDEVWGPVHAWRALADMRAVEALDALISVLSLATGTDGANDYDDSASEELPEIYAALGPVAIPPLAAFLREPANNRWARCTAAEAKEKLTRRYPETRDEVVAILTEVMEATTQHPGPTTEDVDIVNASLVDCLLKLRAVESAPAIERAFAADRVDLTITGDWEDVQIDLGLRTERETPARNYMAERMFGNTPPEVLDRLFSTLGASGGLTDPGFIAPGASWSDPDFVPYHDEGPPPIGALTPAQIKQREAEAKRKAKNKRKMAQQSRKQNKKKKK